jgi:hypothetical protein
LSRQSSSVKLPKERSRLSEALVFSLHDLRIHI